jgi:hypothetical protein
MPAQINDTSVRIGSITKNPERNNDRSLSRIRR